ncbi:MAG TPA: GH3 auxin-responsive promoter family protein [Accumulibacter sp.]|nr:GH3 auxin-responsive promoter family protein [Accumulibacter sp.]HMW16586.1 GH3 auxin-responsive promoter family protein [Accumulibacter sp.]HNC17484.1 GH3 auxin-responsive promoter family protein [Accumulibacter sp.]HND79171.1 GH3 auxin-responsive promoter family protein [Accumulibacter sp.]HNE13740.1 GH3 auxin-responsive promoter family protein [Accumulibacter sp.]
MNATSVSPAPARRPAVAPDVGVAWLTELLAINQPTAYLRSHGSPLTLEAFRAQVPFCQYESLEPWLQRIADGESDVLFRGRPCAYERTGGSTGGSKLIPYSTAGIADFRRAVSPWLAATLERHAITGSVYFSISPVARVAERIAGIPVGLPDAAYLDEAMCQVLMTRSAVPHAVSEIAELATWRHTTLKHLLRASDLELISVWSPTFLLSLLEDHVGIAAWPRLKVISCWADGSSRPYAAELAARFPGVAIEPKGLISTEAVVTVPNADGEPELATSGFFEFLRDGHAFLSHELEKGGDYEVVVTTASGLYRYRSGDIVCCRGHATSGRPILGFVGRSGLHCDLVGEKLSEAFVATALSALPGFSLLIPDARRRAYVLIRESETSLEELARLDTALSHNPQYAYARKLAQLSPPSALRVPSAWAVYEKTMLTRGARLGDIKLTTLRPEPFWLDVFERERQ